MTELEEIDTRKLYVALNAAMKRSENREWTPTTTLSGAKEILKFVIDKKEKVQIVFITSKGT